MKIKSFFVFLATIGLIHNISFAQDKENSNPYAIFGSNPYIAGDKADGEHVKVFVIENIRDNSQIVRLEHNTETGIVTAFNNENMAVLQKKLREGEKAWLTQDRFAEKYYHLSPYSYGAGNPVNIIDINGDSIWYTINDDVITMHFRGSVMNQSSSKINLERRANRISNGITKSFTGPVELNGKTYSMVVDAQIGVANSMSDVASSDHLFVFADRVSDANLKAQGVIDEFGGKAMTIYKNAFRRTSLHEFGHAAGLTHESSTGEWNLMDQGKLFGTSITSDQRRIMVEQHENGNINRGSNSYNPNPYSSRSVIIPNPHVTVIEGNRRVIYHINRVGLRHR